MDLFPLAVLDAPPLTVELSPLAVLFLPPLTVEFCPEAEFDAPVTKAFNPAFALPGSMLALPLTIRLPITSSFSDGVEVPIPKFPVPSIRALSVSSVPNINGTLLKFPINSPLVPLEVITIPRLARDIPKEEKGLEEPPAIIFTLYPKLFTELTNASLEAWVERLLRVGKVDLVTLKFEVKVISPLVELIRLLVPSITIELPLDNVPLAWMLPITSSFSAGVAVPIPTESPIQSRRMTVPSSVQPDVLSVSSAAGAQAEPFHLRTCPLVAPA